MKHESKNTGLKPAILKHYTTEYDDEEEEVAFKTGLRLLYIDK